MLTYRRAYVMVSIHNKGETEMQVELKLKNKDCPGGFRKFMVDLDAVESIVQWYCAFWSGDRIVVKVNGKKQKLYRDWGIDGGVKL